MVLWMNVVGVQEEETILYVCSRWCFGFERVRFELIQELLLAICGLLQKNFRGTTVAHHGQSKTLR